MTPAAPKIHNVSTSTASNLRDRGRTGDDVAQFDQRTVRTEFHADSKAQAQLMRSGGGQGVRKRPVEGRSPGRGSRITTGTNDMSARSSLRLLSISQSHREHLTP